MLDQSQLREQRRGHLMRLAAGFDGFKDRELALWLDETEHVEPDKLGQVVDRFLLKDPRESESVRSRKPRLSDMMRYLPARPSSAPESSGKARGWSIVDGDGGEWSDSDFDETSKAERTRIARYIADFWGDRINERAQESVRQFARRLDPEIFKPKQEALI